MSKDKSTLNTEGHELEDPSPMVLVVQKYALEHYNDGGGWDYIIETYTDSELQQLVEMCDYQTENEVIRYIGNICRMWAERDVTAHNFFREYKV